MAHFEKFALRKNAVKKKKKKKEFHRTEGQITSFGKNDNESSAQRALCPASFLTSFRTHNYVLQC